MEGTILVMSFVLYPYVYFLSKVSFLSTPVSLYELAKLRGNSIFINVNEKQINKRSIYNYEIFELKKIINTLKKHKVRDFLFLKEIVFYFPYNFL